MTDRLRESVFFQRFAKWCFVVAALVLLVMFSGCTPADVTPPATTGTAPTVRPEEDEPGWICSVNDDSCDETSF